MGAGQGRVKKTRLWEHLPALRRHEHSPTGNWSSVASGVLSVTSGTLTTAGLTGWQSAFKRRLQRWLTLSDCTDRSREGVPCSVIQYGSQIWMRKHVERLPAQHMATTIEPAAEPV